MSAPQSQQNDISSMAAIGAQGAVEANVTGQESQEYAMSIQAKYEEEKNKRMRPEMTDQFVDLHNNEQFKELLADPWIDDEELARSAPITDDLHLKYVVLGGGFGGLYYAVRLVEAGLDVESLRVIETGGGYGGTWYWNRYPGIMCDVESYGYAPFLEETGYMPKHRYSYGFELRKHADRIADKWNLREKTMFRTKVKSMTWDDTKGEWIIKLRCIGSPEKDLTMRSRYVIMNPGVLSNPHLAGIQGTEKFQGQKFHTSRWNYKISGGSPEDTSLTNLEGKRVGIIGTGATAVQCVPHLAKYAKDLYIFQRTPSSCQPRGQQTTNQESWSSITKTPGWQKARRVSLASNLSNTRTKEDLVNDEWSSAHAYCGLIGGPAADGLTMDKIPEHIGALYDLDFARAERSRARVDSIIKNPSTAASLKAYYPVWCKRPTFHDDYLQTFNQPNVHLIDTHGKGVDEITSTSVRVGADTIPLDVLIFSTGFRSPGLGDASTRANITVTGRGGQTMSEKFTTTGYVSLHGIMTHNFPNLFFPGPSGGGATANYLHVQEELSRHVAYIISQAEAKAKAEGSRTASEASGTVTEGSGRVIVEPSHEAEEAWTLRVAMKAGWFAGMSTCTPGYLTGEGKAATAAKLSPQEQFMAARWSIWAEGLLSYVEVLEGWRAEGKMEGLDVTVH